ncbi:AMPKBI-domain-containing protein [Lindgomyces ingoldianus]|uniref:AMPKBI-domain-containing protein n=1 Tax=Lindgomyces ingoldianus TaxID=673940 RepID=A0ACB6R4G3_9PLEO|nr:AMPKBI-domain-containing protein [Lindgomyces ingoldianus]KAF2474183.1 AMPKBI-domain-containing protein [Lindgomyces ingoldianus]
MGNQSSSSRSTTPTSNPQSPSVTTSHGSARNAILPHPRELTPAYPAQARRRESIQALSFHNKAHAAPPSASFESAPASRDRTRAHTIAAAVSSTTAQVAHQLRAATESLQEKSERPAPDDRMGNEQSRQKGQVQGQVQGQGHARELTPPKPAKAAPPHLAPSPQTKPVDVPTLPKDESHASRTVENEPVSSIDPADASQDYFIPPSQYSRPPRLPLPIEEEPHTPGSPIISPHDLVSPINPDDIDGELPRKGSVLSSTTAEDDDLGDEYRAATGDMPSVPTLIEWEGPGERVYVTGTFAGWNRKYKLHRNGPSPKKDVLSAMVNIVPGTHHLKFIVDGDMKTSDKLPTAVDYTNILMNYLEISVDDVPQPPTATSEEAKKPEPVPVQELQPPPGIFPPQTLPPTPEILPVTQKPPGAAPPKPKVPTQVASPKRYHQSIPRYLLDLDAPEESSRLARANAVASNLPTPPTLPMFLSKSILNGTTPMKDDSSVLIMPNHTVLNHLATSSIKDNILATSATTRYKHKFLTTIMYKPKNEDPDRFD